MTTSTTTKPTETPQERVTRKMREAQDAIYSLTNLLAAAQDAGIEGFGEGEHGGRMLNNLRAASRYLLKNRQNHLGPVVASFDRLVNHNQENSNE